MKNDEIINNGAFLIARKSFESELWRNKPSSWWKIWCYIVGNVQHTDFKDLKRGQGFFNFREIVRMKDIGSGVTYGMLDKFVRYAKASNMLSTRKATQGVLVFVANYDKYQSFESYKVDSSVDEVVEVKSKQSRNEVDNINKNDKKTNNDKKAKPIVATKVAESYEGLENSSINSLIESFDKVNPSFNRLFSNKSERAALERLIKANGTEKLKKVIESLPRTNSLPYAPRITKPTQLENKLGDLIAFLQQENAKKGGKVAIQ